MAMQANMLLFCTRNVVHTSLRCSQLKANSDLHRTVRLKSQANISSAKERYDSRSHSAIVLDNEPPKRLMVVRKR